MNNRGNAENCVEEPLAPEWLSKLERRRENMQRATKLSHEVGAGAPCVECGDNCPGLDLHFWRKVCRNCKCRKDQHKCNDEDLSSWAQFEILGQVCSKPAYIKIKALASHPVQLEWVPPNTNLDVISEYMEKLGATKMPITGSEAAQRRRQQLEFQVPPHDLNADLCDNLTDAETSQLQQYVSKIRENCVGQGIVIRIGNVGVGLLDIIPDKKLQSAIDVNSPTNINSTLVASSIAPTDSTFYSPLASKARPNACFSIEMRQDTPTIGYSIPTKANLKESTSADSGFGSKASTPIYNMCYGSSSSIEPSQGALPITLQQLNISDSSYEVPSIDAGKCRDCNKTIYNGEIAVRAERAGKDIAWHPECFKCFTCRELLADLVYFFHGGKVYCGRDLAINLRIPRCKACDELIFTKEYTAAEDATFHIKHFCCYHCDIPLAGLQYIPDEKTNMPLCLTCFDNYFAAICQKCRFPIKPTDQGVVWGDIHWHSTCFICAGCGHSLIGGRFCVKNNMPFCSQECLKSIKAL